VALLDDVGVDVEMRPVEAANQIQAKLAADGIETFWAAFWAVTEQD
jgi:hypothetical protein